MLFISIIGNEAYVCLQQNRSDAARVKFSEDKSPRASSETMGHQDHLGSSIQSFGGWISAVLESLHRVSAGLDTVAVDCIQSARGHLHAGFCTECKAFDPCSVPSLKTWADSRLAIGRGLPVPCRVDPLNARIHPRKQKKQSDAPALLGTAHWLGRTKLTRERDDVLLE